METEKSERGESDLPVCSVVNFAGGDRNVTDCKTRSALAKIISHKFFNKIIRFSEHQQLTSRQPQSISILAVINV